MEITEQKMREFARKYFLGKKLHYASNECIQLQAGTQFGIPMHYEYHIGKMSLHLEQKDWRAIRNYLNANLHNEKLTSSKWFGRNNCQWTIDNDIHTVKDLFQAFLDIRSIIEPVIEKFEGKEPQDYSHYTLDEAKEPAPLEEIETLKTLEKALESVYISFMQEMNIDSKTGIVNYDSFQPVDNELRFAGYPYVGSQYMNARIKILFIGLDLGYDEKKDDNSYHTFVSRRQCISYTSCGHTHLPAKKPFNDHMSGTYAFALALLKDFYEWQDAWKTLSMNDHCLTRKIIELNHNQLPVEVLDYVALTNLFKFVTVNRKTRTGSSNRKWTKKDIETNLLLKEIEILNPNIIISQGSVKYLPSYILKNMKSKHILINAHHPSAWRNGENKIGYVRQLLNL